MEFLALTTLDKIKAQLSRLDESQLHQVYAFIQKLPEDKSSTAEPGLLSQLRQIQIEDPPDFAANIYQYLNQEYSASDALS